MYVEHPYEGELPNGIRVGMNMDDAIKIDKQLSKLSVNIEKLASYVD